MSPRSISMLKAFGRRALFKASLGLGCALAFAAAPVGIVSLAICSALVIAATSPWTSAGHGLRPFGVPDELSGPLAALAIGAVAGWALFDGWRCRAVFGEATWRRPMRALFIVAGAGLILGVERFLFVLSNGQSPALLRASGVAARGDEPAPGWESPSSTPSSWRGCLSPLWGGAAVLCWAARHMVSWSLSFLWLCASFPLALCLMPAVAAEEMVCAGAKKAAYALSPKAPPSGAASGARGALARLAGAVASRAKSYAQGLADEAGQDLAIAERSALEGEAGAGLADGSKPRRI